MQRAFKQSRCRYTGTSPECRLLSTRLLLQTVPLASYSVVRTEWNIYQHSDPLDVCNHVAQLLASICGGVADLTSMA